MSMHIGRPCEPLVKVGDHVYLGQKIADSQAPVCAPIHASVSGTVVAVEPRPYSMGGNMVSVVIENDFQDTMAKYQIIKAARLYRQDLAIAALNSGTSRTLAAQAADELLNISGISASFVLYPDNDQVIISARSIGSANVQVILEPLGGGGNAATAGAQVKDSNVKTTLDQLVSSIDRYCES